MCYCKRSTLVQNIMSLKLTQTVDQLSARDCRVLLFIGAPCIHPRRDICCRLNWKPHDLADTFQTL